MLSKIDKNYKQLLEICKEYCSDSSYVYKLCNNNHYRVERKWLVVLKKLDDTITNEHRTGIVNDYFAKYRANKLKVIKIFDITNPDITRYKVVNLFTVPGMSHLS